MVGHNSGPDRIAVRKWKLQSEHLVPARLPVQASEIPVYDKDLSPECESLGLNLPGHPVEPVVSGPDNGQGPHVHSVTAHGPQSR